MCTRMKICGDITVRKRPRRRHREVLGFEGGHVSDCGIYVNDEMLSQKGYQENVRQDM